MNISQWKNGDRTFFSLEVHDRLLLINRHCCSPLTPHNVLYLVSSPTNPCPGQSPPHNAAFLCKLIAGCPVRCPAVAPPREAAKCKHNVYLGSRHPLDTAAGTPQHHNPGVLCTALCSVTCNTRSKNCIFSLSIF